MKLVKLPPVVALLPKYKPNFQTSQPPLTPNQLITLKLKMVDQKASSTRLIQTWKLDQPLLIRASHLMETQSPLTSSIPQQVEFQQLPNKLDKHQEENKYPSITL